jgi:hypothetical protein
MAMADTQTDSRVPYIVAAMFLAVVYLVSFVASPGGGLYELSLCPLKTVTGVPCPLCGMTRAFVSVSHGDMASAWALNAASIPVYVAGLGMLALVSARCAGARWNFAWLWKVSTLCWLGLVVFTVVMWGVRLTGR